MADTRLQAAATAHVDGCVRASGLRYKHSMNAIVVHRVFGKRRAAATPRLFAFGEPPSMFSAPRSSSRHAANRVAYTAFARSGSACPAIAVADATRLRSARLLR
jgi:hypothetical protein